MAQKTSIHSEAGLHRKLVLFAAQLEGYLAHLLIQTPDELPGDPPP